MANESINLNLIPKGEMPVIHVSQFDNGRQFNINLLKGSDEYTLPAGYTAVLNCRKADRNIVTLATTSVLSNALTFTTTTQLCACAGKNLCEVVIKDAEDYQVGTLNFILEVEKDPLQGGIDSTSEIHNLEDQIEEITTEIISENYYTKTETDTLLDAKANAADVYTKTEVDTALSGKANAADVYTKSQVDTALSAKANTADLATVATTGSYTDLTNKPSIPDAQVQSDYAQVDNTKVDYIKNKPDLSIYAKESDLIIATGTENEAPYQIRQAPSNIGNMALEKLVGVSVCFNQLVNTGDTSINTVSGHKYYTSVNGVKSIINGGSAVSINDASEDNIIDLTAMFGSTVADYIYTLESGNAGAGVSLFKSLFADEYYPYTPNTLMSAKPTGKKIVGKNLFGGAYDTMFRLPFVVKKGTVISASAVKIGEGMPNVRYYDENQTQIDFWGLDTTGSAIEGRVFRNFTLQADIYYVKFDTVEVTDMQFEIGAINTAYEPYTETTIVYSGNELRGLLKVGTDGLYADGDIDDGSGSTQVRYELRAYQSGDESLTDAITDGTNTVVKLDTPTTAVSTAWSNPIIAKEGGTEEFTDTRTVKMFTGHDTIYSKKTDYRYWG